MFSIEGDRGVVRKEGRGLVLGFTISAWVLTVLIFPVYLMHGTHIQQGWFEWFVWGLTVLLTSIYLLLLRHVVQIDKTAYVITVQNGPKSEKASLGRFQSLQLGLKRRWPYRTYTAILIGENGQAQILTTLSETSLRKKTQPIAEWLGVPISGV